MTASAPSLGRAARERSFRGRIDSLSLVTRALAASLLLAALVAAVFAVLVLASSALRSATSREARSKDVTAATLEAEKLVLDVESGVRGFALTDNERFLQPYNEAKARLPGQLARLEHLAASSPEAPVYIWDVAPVTRRDASSVVLTDANREALWKDLASRRGS